MKAVEPACHGRPFGHRDHSGDVLEPDQVERRVAHDAVDLVTGEEMLGADERGHRSGPRTGAASPQSLDRMESWRSARLDQDDQAQTPLRQAADLVRVVGDTDPLCRH